jgi:hypothetical protein
MLPIGKTTAGAGLVVVVVMVLVGSVAVVGRVVDVVAVVVVVVVVTSAIHGTQLSALRVKQFVDRQRRRAPK